MKHVVVFTQDQIRKLLEGQLKYYFHFFKKKPEFLNKLSVGNIVYFRKSRGDILGQFEVGKIIIIEGLENRDWKVVKELETEGMTEEDFKEKINQNSILIIIQITNLEQFITSPIEIDKRSKKEWITLDY